jgi:hypothetical protein
MIEAVLVENANPRHPFGARGVGEVPIVPPMAAVANAIADAIGACATCRCRRPGGAPQSTTTAAETSLRGAGRHRGNLE